MNTIFSYTMQMCEWEFTGSRTKAWSLNVLLQIFKLVEAKLMVWGMFSLHALGPLVRVHRLLTKDVISKHFCWPSYVKLMVTTTMVTLMVYPNSESYFQQDNESCHSASTEQIWLEKYEGEFILLGWPPQAPDLNSYEHLWCEVERTIRYLDPQLSNLTLLKSPSKSSSMIVDFTNDLYQYLVESMQRRINAVLKPKRFRTKCWRGGYNKLATHSMYIKYEINIRKNMYFNL